MRIDVMVDIETLGTEFDSTIIQIAAVAFDIKTGENILSFNKIADISENEKYDMNVSGDTLKWWLNTDKELLQILVNSGEGSSSNLIKEFYSWLTSVSLMGELHLWGNGILFDNAILKYQMGLNDRKYPVHMRRDRDLRTLVDLMCMKLNATETDLRIMFYDKDITAHDAMNDVMNQINMAVACYKELIGGDEK